MYGEGEQRKLSFHAMSDGELSAETRAWIVATRDQLVAEGMAILRKDPPIWLVIGANPVDEDSAEYTGANALGGNGMELTSFMRVSVIHLAELMAQTFEIPFAQAAYDLVQVLTAEMVKRLVEDGDGSSDCEARTE